MGDINYVWPDAMPICGVEICSIEAIVNESLASYDPTPASEESGLQTWTEQDSKKTGIDHAGLEKFYGIVSQRVASKEKYSSGFPGWSVHQLDKLGAILKNEPQPNAGFCFKGIPGKSDVLTPLGMSIESPLQQTADGWCAGDLPYSHVPEGKNFIIKKGAQVLLRLPVQGVDFIDIETGRCTDQAGLLVYVSFQGGEVNSYRICSDGLREKTEEVIIHPE